MRLKLGVNFLFLAARNHALVGGDKRPIAAILRNAPQPRRQSDSSVRTPKPQIADSAPATRSVPSLIAGAYRANREPHPCRSTVMVETFLLAEEKHV